MVSGEQLAKAREALYFTLADLTNEGLSLWCMVKSVLNVVPYQVAYQLPVGTNDVTNMLYRSLLPQAGVTVLDGAAAQVELTQATPIDNVAGRFSAGGVIGLQVSWSEDGTTWNVLTQLNAVEVDADSNFTIDLDNTANAKFWRLDDWSESTDLPTLADVQFRRVSQELTMAQLNRDDYVNLPNKRYPGAKALQYWFDKQIEPRVYVWPQPTGNVDQIVMWSEQQIQDPGQLTNELAVPARWYRAVLGRTAYQLAFRIPASELPPGRLAELKAEADEAMISATDGESDMAPMQLAPRIGVYTR